MENLLMKYFEARIKNAAENREPGPVITISREYGCPSKILAALLVDKLRVLDPETPSHPYQWKWIGRELLEESAKNLKVDPKHINHIFDYHERSVIDDILAATRRDGSYKSDHLIKKSVGKVIHSMGINGHVIIVGRAGVVLTRDIQRSLHIRLMAPLEWRTKRIMENLNISQDKAVELITSKDDNRKRFLEYYLGNKFRIQIFDVVYNCGYMTLDEIAGAIIFSSKERGII